MAINIEWQVKPPRKGGEREETQMFPRITDSEVVDEQRLAKLIASHGSLSRGNAKAALNDMAEVMAGLLRDGKTILRVVIKVLTNLKRFHHPVNSTLSI